MKNIIIILAIVASLGVGYKILLNNNFNKTSIKTKGQKLIVYKSPTCGCCGNYISYLKKEGYEVEVKNSDTLLNQIKSEKNIPNNMQSCHTTIAGNYYIEGHIPVLAINKLFKENLDIAGIAMPGMPTGSPGMPGIKKGSFKIMTISKNNQINPYVSL